MTGGMSLVLLGYAAIAIALGIIIVGVWVAAVFGFDRLGLQFESRPNKLARCFFTEKYADESISWIKLAATEPERWIVGVFYGSFRPPRYKFFSVDRSTEEVAELDDASTYAPKVWR